VRAFTPFEIESLVYDYNLLIFLSECLFCWMSDKFCCLLILLYCISNKLIVNQQDEAGAAAINTVELDVALGGHAVQHREIQGHETYKFLSHFKPCIIPEEGGVASGLKHVEEKEYLIRLFACKGKHVVHVTEVGP